MAWARRVVWVLALMACGGGDSTGGPSPQAKRGIQFVSGTNITDSADAILSPSLVVEVHDSTGRIAPAGTVVRFTSIQRRTLVNDYEAYVQSLTSQQFGTLATGTTDAAGRTGVIVRLGLLAGPARIAVSAPTLGVVDTARYTIIPASAVSLMIAPGDTALYVGRSYTFRGGVIDRAGNVRNDPIVWTASGPGVSVSNAGVVTALLIGRYQIIGRVSSDRAVGVNVSVIPQARLAGSLGTHIVAIDLDGSNQLELGPVTVSSIGAHPRWIPGTNTVIYSHLDGPIQTLFTADENRVLKRFFATLPSTVSHQAEPAPSGDGRWLYFSAHDTRCSPAAYCLYRSRTDGTAPELLGNSIDSGSVTWQPSSSPDGSKVAFVTSNGAAVIRVLDIASRTASSWSVAGQHPAWSPTGTHIAFLPNGGGPLMVMNPDGVGVRAVTIHSYVEQPLSWSVDGRWIIARSDGGLELVDAVSGEVMPVRHLGALTAPSFK